MLLYLLYRNIALRYRGNRLDVVKPRFLRQRQERFRVLTPKLSSAMQLFASILVIRQHIFFKKARRQCPAVHIVPEIYNIDRGFVYFIYQSHVVFMHCCKIFSHHLRGIIQSEYAFLHTHSINIQVLVCSPVANI